MKDVLARIRLVIKDQDMELADFAFELDEKRQRIQDILGGRQRLPAEVACKIVEKFGVDGNWLFLGGKGFPMYRQPTELMMAVTGPEKTLLHNYRLLNRRQIEALETMTEVLAESS